ncbi:MAG TPA: hypothetical protein VF751_06110 [Chthoniobacterales bacterium]
MKAAASKKTAPGRLFVLTPEEKRILCFVLIAFLLGVGAKRYRESHAVPPLKTAVVATSRTVALPAEKRAAAKRRKLAK